VVVKGLCNAVHLYREPDWNALPLELSSQRDHGRSAPTMAKQLDASLTLLFVGYGVVMVNVEPVQNQRVRFVDFLVFAETHVAFVRIVALQSLNHANFGMVRLIVSDEAA